MIWLLLNPCVLSKVSKKNLMEIVKKLMLHVDKAEGTTYRDELLTKIIDICSQSNYQYITNFEWSVLQQYRLIFNSDFDVIFHSVPRFPLVFLLICLTGTSVSSWSWPD